MRFQGYAEGLAYKAIAESRAHHAPVTVELMRSRWEKFIRDVRAAAGVKVERKRVRHLGDAGCVRLQPESWEWRIYIKYP